MMRESTVTDVHAYVDRLRREHAQIDQRLQQLERHISLSPEEQRERSELKKLKLQLKDTILHYSK
jgi:uncharacterized protein YdcH (DUF465 family)